MERLGENCQYTAIMRRYSLTYHFLMFGTMVEPRHAMSLKNSEGELYINVFNADLSQAILIPWKEKLSACGLLCEFHPEFRPETDRGLIPIKITVKLNAFPKAEVYGTLPMWDGFNWFVRKYLPPKSIETGNKKAMPSEVKEILRKSKWSVNLEPMGETTLTIRTTLFVAATLAFITEGALNINGRWFWGDTAIQIAYVEAEAFEAEITPDNYYVEKFTSWEPQNEHRSEVEEDDIPY